MRNILVGSLALMMFTGGSAGWYLFAPDTAASTVQEEQAAQLASLTPTAPRTLVPDEGDAVIADAIVLPLRNANLNFELSGTVTELLVTEGQNVEAGAPLAQLNTGDLSLGVDQARTVLEQALANVQRLQDGATPAEIAQAKAQVALARAQLRQIQGGVSVEDTNAAQAQIDQARATLEKLKGGPKATEIESALATRDQAAANLRAVKDALSAAKTKAQLEMERSATALVQAQSRYSTALETWQKGDTDDLEARDALTQAEAAMRSAELAMQQAQVTYNAERQAEVSGVQTAEAQLRDVNAQLQQLLAGADMDERLAAQAQVAQGQAQLEQLRGKERVGSLEAASASVAVAEANLQVVMSDPRATDLAVAQAQVHAAEVALAKAELMLKKATLRAPFGGTVVEVNLNVGEVASPQSVVIVIADFSSWKIETVDLTELDIVRVRKGTSVTVAFDALPDFTLLGKVTAIEAIGKSKQGGVLYTVTITPQSWDDRILWNMTASISIAP